MRRIADAFPTRRFDVFILFAKLAPFLPEEIALAICRENVRLGVLRASFRSSEEPRNVTSAVASEKSFETASLSRSAFF